MKIHQTQVAISLTLSNSILMADLGPDKISEIPDTTTCQDILHSIYNLRQTLYGLLLDDLEAVTYLQDYLQSELVVTVLELIQEELRPLNLAYHSTFFKNTRYEGRTVISIPKKNVSKAKRVAFISQFRHIASETKAVIDILETIRK